jgi:hypothetical protein
MTRVRTTFDVTRLQRGVTGEAVRRGRHRHRVERMCVADVILDGPGWATAEDVLSVC